MQPGHLLIRCLRENGEGLQRLILLLPLGPDPREGEWHLVASADVERLLLLAIRFPLEKPIGWDEASVEGTTRRSLNKADRLLPKSLERAAFGQQHRIQRQA